MGGHDEERAASGHARLTAPDPGDAKQAWGSDDRIAAGPPPASHSTAALHIPSKDELEAIAGRQDAKRKAMQAAKLHTQRHEEEAAAAALIQRNYRGYKQRRELAGMGLDASTRWVEVRETLPLRPHHCLPPPPPPPPPRQLSRISRSALSAAVRPIIRKCRSANGDLRAPQAIKEARWRNATRPMPRNDRTSGDRDKLSPAARSRAASDAAKENWRRIGEVARRAGGDDAVPDESDTDETQLSPEEHERRRARKAEAKREREKTAKVMDLQYWLEMVDQKHRYGSNLRAYHSEWKKSGTHENFFYWLDYGEGRRFEVPTCSRERLEREQVRYLNREERQNYLVKLDSEGRLCWAKNGERITTSTEFKDSVKGIVPNADGTPAYSRDSTSSNSSSSNASSMLSTGSTDPEGDHYVNHDLEKAKGIKKIKHVSAAAILNHLLRRSVKPNSWIFVADTSFRLYVGIKQSGAFQHSSFLHGARISAAGLIKIKDGQLRRLSPLSGHYRPPTSNFRAFVHSLRDAGVDMNRVSISRSYAILVGLEAYVKTRRKFKHGAEHASHGKEKVLHPEELAKRKEQEKDKSKSAERERQILAEAAAKQEDRKRSNSLRLRILRKLGVGGAANAPKGERTKRSRGETSSRDVESGIPPDGKR
ncbi:iq calmodulin-binding motif protein [Diplodia corticola]|uniref:Iq calmodulin-binding motif protein n=1 Tax=Diplodia corticola TaxID=236234 RepID=A0A1J9QY32_9PEZI|nr:iq calmodulin-binding motif protein [Diplodia corticola]OJD32906.1 iq calmodulin-binding motif protein [Diplodia corticola]